MADYRVLVSLRNLTEPPKNAISNTLYFEIIGVGADLQAIADDVATVYQRSRDGDVAGNLPLFPTNWQIDVRVYDLADAKPRPIKAQKTIGGGAASTLGPREVALCLSYYADRNLPRTRGRIYLGPFRGTTTGSEKPTDALLQGAMDHGSRLGNIGGANVLWSVHSTVSGETNHIKHIWCDDAWDTMRSRGLAATKRSTADV